MSDNAHADSYVYGMTYNSMSLPPYNARQSDHWGFYNGKPYGTVSYDSLHIFRTPDEQKMQAEMLTRITYPTGGWTDFEYEAHHYGKVAGQFPFTVVEDTGLGGGLRTMDVALP